MDRDTPLDSADQVKPDLASLGVCETTGKRKTSACETTGKRKPSKESSCMEELAKGNYERGLPVEKWEQVIKNASPTDLCSVMMTSSYMNSVASHPDLWADMRVNTRKVKKNGLKELYAISRFKKIKEMYFNYMEFTSEELEHVLKDIPGTPLESVDFSYVDLSGAPPQLLAKAVSELKHVNLSFTKLTSQQCEAIANFSANNSKLKKLSMVGNDLSRVDPNTLAGAVGKLEDVDLCRTQLTNQQSEAIVSFAAHDSKLKKLSLFGNDLDQADPNTLARAVAKIEDVDLGGTELTSQQCEAIARALDHDYKLKKLRLAGNDLSGVDPTTLARAVLEIEDVNLRFTKLTTQQCEAIASFAPHDSKLKKLSLVANDLSQVDPNTLARAVVKLEDVDLGRTKLTNQQSEAIARALVHDSKLKKIDLACNDLSGVDPNTLAKAVAKLEDSKLKKLSLDYNDLSQADPNTLARAVVKIKIEDVNLRRTKLTSQQCDALVSFAAHDSKLKKLSMAYNDLSQADPNIIARAIW